MPPIVYLPEARDDMDTAYLQYEVRSAGLGERLLAAVAQAVQKIEATPFLYGEVVPGIRAAPTRRFSFVVYYRIEPTQVVIIAVRHGHSDPSVWQRRN